MLRIWLREWSLFRGSFWSWAAILALFAVIDIANPGSGQGALEIAGFAAGMSFAGRALSRDARSSTLYFASLPLDPGRSRRCCLDGGIFWLWVLLLAALTFQYAGPAKLIVHWLLAQFHLEPSAWTGSRLPALDRLALPMLGFWLTGTILLSVGLLKGLTMRLIDVLLLLPILLLVGGAVVARQTWLASGGGWRAWCYFAGTGLATLLLTWLLARGCLSRIERNGTELGTKGVLT